MAKEKELVLYNKLAKYYDKLYSHKNYNKEAAFLVQIIKKNFKKSKILNILDIACGTGTHLQKLENSLPNANFYGLDVNTGMLTVAKSKLKNTKLKLGDFKKFDFGIKFDVIFCLSSSIQYLSGVEELNILLKNIKRILNPNGLFIFDLAYCKELWQEGYTNISTYADNKIQIAEIYKSRSANNFSYWDPIYLVKKNNKVDFIVDHHKIFLFSIPEVMNYLKREGFNVKLFKDFNASKTKGKIPIFVCIRGQ